MVKKIHNSKNKVTMILTKEGQKLIKEIEYKMNKVKERKGIKYSFFEDILARATKKRIKKIKHDKFLIIQSQCPKGILVGKSKKHCAIVRTDGKIDAIYYTKKILDFSELFIKDQRDKKSRLLEIGQLEDAEKQNKFIKTPDYLVQIINIEKKKTITVSKKITGAITIDKFYKKSNTKQKNKLLKKLKRTYMNLIINDLFPSQNKVDQIWVNEKNLDLIITDSTIGPTPSYRNKLSLLITIKKDKSFPKPNWDLIEKDFNKFKTYWNTLTKKQHKQVLDFELEQLINEIKEGSKARKNWKEIRVEVKELIITLFPNSLSAQKIRDEKNEKKTNCSKSKTN